jgi:uncharacterized protein YndB with AHSA1/START domain
MSIAESCDTMDRDSVETEVAPIQCEAETEINAQPEVVFAIISDHRRLPTWIPGLRRVDVDESQALSPGGIGTRRRLHPIVGPSGVEMIIEFEPPRKMVYRASDESLRGLLTRHRSEISCESSAAGTRLRWIVRGIPSQTWWKRILAKAMFSHAQQTGLANLRRRFPVEKSIGRSGT